MFRRHTNSSISGASPLSPPLARAGACGGLELLVRRRRSYVHDMGDSEHGLRWGWRTLLLDRINILRGDIKRTSTGLASGVFQFAGLGATQTKELVEKLLKDHRYIFPVDPRTLPFMHPAMCAAIKEGVFTRNFKANNMHLFISTSKKHPKQLELPDAMVALVATALYASLMEYRTTGERQTIAFTEGAYEDTYRNHMKTLPDTRDYAPNALHKVLHRLFNEVIDCKSTQPDAGSSSTLINLVEVDESD
ncbi:hypothetical protein B0H10DRAFT_2221938 [Mycena sp. CBHHK59/15]|nr:hypothetical protein B0H10DRAFT_2221938 [Mycena sp. CBHHK59/15]